MTHGLVGGGMEFVGPSPQFKGAVVVPFDIPINQSIGFPCSGGCSLVSKTTRRPHDYGRMELDWILGGVWFCVNFLMFAPLFSFSGFFLEFLENWKSLSPMNDYCYCTEYYVEYCLSIIIIIYHLSYLLWKKRKREIRKVGFRLREMARQAEE